MQGRVREIGRVGRVRVSKGGLRVKEGSCNWIARKSIDIGRVGECGREDVYSEDK